MTDWVLILSAFGVAAMGTAAMAYRHMRRANEPFNLKPASSSTPAISEDVISGVCSNKQLSVVELNAISISTRLSKMGMELGCNAVVVALSSVSPTKPSEYNYWVGYKGPLLVIDGLARRLTVIADGGWGVSKEPIMATGVVVQAVDEDLPPVEIPGDAAVINGMRT